MSAPRIGQRVELVEKKLVGKVAFYGDTDFASGKWVGVVLEEPKGKNNGSVKGRQYFSCPENCGLFVRLSQLKILNDDGSAMTTSFSGIRPPSVSSSTTSLPSPAGSTASEPHTSTSQTQPVSQIKAPTVRQMSQSMVQSLTSPAGDHSACEAEIRDLKEKQETLLMKRREDREKLKEYEKLKIQIEQLLEFKKQMQQAQAELQNQLTAAKKEAKDAIEEKERHAEETRDLEEAAEMATLDKEMAEEKLEQVHSELESVKERLEEVTLELEILKEEIATKGSEGASNSYEVKQLESKNERLTEALLRLRDISNEDKAEINKLTKELERAKSEASEFLKAKEKLNAEVQSLQAEIVDLKEHVDSALGAQEMVEKLTVKNLALEDEIEKLADDRDVLEKLVETNEQLLEASKEKERFLVEERDLIHSHYKNALFEKEQVESVVEDFKATIERFREERNKLNSEIEKLKSQGLETVSEAHKAVAQEVEHNQENIEFKIRFHEKKAKDIEEELRKSEEKYVKLQEDMAQISEVVKGQNGTIEELKSRLEGRDSEVHQLKKALKQKIDEASEAQIRKEMAEKKLHSSSKDQDDRSVKLQQELDELRAQMQQKEKEYEETMNHLQSDIEDLERERDKLRAKLNSGAKTTSPLDLSLTNASLTSITTPTRHVKPIFSTSTPYQVSREDHSFVSQIDLLKKALARVTKEKRDLLMEKTARELQLKPVLSERISRSKPLWLLRQQNRENEIDPKQEKLLSLRQRMDELGRRSRTLLLRQSILQSSDLHKKDFILAKLDIESKYQRICEEVEELKREYSDEERGLKSDEKHEMKIAARIRLPVTSCSQTVRLNVTGDQLLRLHSKVL